MFDLEERLLEYVSDVIRLDTNCSMLDVQRWMFNVRCWTFYVTRWTFAAD